MNVGSSRTCDVAVVGSGLIGLATAFALSERRDFAVAVLEAEPRLAAHQSGHNSGVIHSGLYYRPGSLKAQLCTAGREALYRFCAERGVAHLRCGKLVVATRAEEVPRLEELERRGRANGLVDLERLDAGGMAAREPQVAGLAGLWVPATGVVDYPSVARELAGAVGGAGGEVLIGARVHGARAEARELRVATAAGEIRCRLLVNCAGLQSDRVARACGARPAVRIVPFRGDYHRLAPPAASRVRGLIYPVPDPTFPFLGVHLKRGSDGAVKAGPNAVLALDRHGYRRLAFSPRDAASALTWPGLWRLAARHWRTGLYEVRRSLSRRLFARDLARLLPGLDPADLLPGGCGIRAQAVGRDGALIDDFVFAESTRALHVVNAPSPGATACLAIGRHLAEMARARLAA